MHLIKYMLLTNLIIFTDYNLYSSVLNGIECTMRRFRKMRDVPSLLRHYVLLIQATYFLFLVNLTNNFILCINNLV